MGNYDEMSLEELIAKNQELMQQRGEAQQAIEAEQMQLNAAMDKKIAEERLAAEIAEMSEAERSVMAELLANPPAITMSVSEGDVATIEMGGDN